MNVDVLSWIPENARRVAARFNFIPGRCMVVNKEIPGRVAMSRAKKPQQQQENLTIFVQEITSTLTNIIKL